MSRVDANIDLELLDTEELEELRDEVEEAIASIKGQVEAARADPEDTADERRWLASARHALRMKGLLHQRINRRLSVIRKELRAQRNVTECEAFKEAARQLLDAETFQRILDKALRG